MSCWACRISDRDQAEAIATIDDAIVTLFGTVDMYGIDGNQDLPIRGRRDKIVLVTNFRPVRGMGGAFPLVTGACLKRLVVEVLDFLSMLSGSRHLSRLFEASPKPCSLAHLRVQTFECNAALFAEVEEIVCRLHNEYRISTAAIACAG